ncbi:MAG: hypothetical protein LIP08_02230 [Bacteroides sp.]|nr:hypothetical protein [Bacteroides sp.]
MSGSRAKIEQISDLYGLSARIRDFGSSTLGHLSALDTRLQALVQQAYSNYQMMEDKKATILRRLEAAQRAYQACLNYNSNSNEENNRNEQQNCECERRELQECKELYQEICTCCEKASYMIREVETDRSSLESHIGSFRGRIANAVSSASGTLSGIGWKADDYVSIRSTVHALTMPESRSGNGGTSSTSGQKRSEETKTHALNMLPELKEVYSFSHLKSSSWLIDTNGTKIIRIKKETADSCLCSGFDTGSGREVWLQIEAILKYNHIVTIRCWIESNKLSFYKSIGFSVDRDDTNEGGGYVVSKTF